MTLRVVVLGAGFGGLEVAAGLSERFGDQAEVTLIDRRESFVFGFAKLDVMFGARTAAEVSLEYARIRKPGVRFVRASVTGIDAQTRRVTTDAGVFDADRLVIALGADVDANLTEGMAAGGHEYYSTDGAFALREVLDRFAGGRVVIGVAGPVFKCPPAPSETALLVHDLLERRGLREASSIDLVMPLPAPVPPVPTASAGLLEAFTERGIGWHPRRRIQRLDVDAREVVFDAGERMPYDLFLGVPVHVVPPVVAASGLAPDGWIDVDPATLRTRYEHVWAIGDVAKTGTPKAGVFAEGQARVVVAAIAAEAGLGAPLDYDGTGTCYIGFGGAVAGKVDVAFAPGASPTGSFTAASAPVAAQKEQYRAERIQRWFEA